MNRLEIRATLVAREEVRYTPAGIEVWEGELQFRGEVFGADGQRKLEYDFPAVSFGKCASELNRLPLGSEITVKGFLAPRSLKTRRLIVHITEYI